MTAGSLDDQVRIGFVDWKYAASRAGGGLAIVPMDHSGVVALLDPGGVHRGSIERSREGPGEFLVVRGLDWVDDRLQIAHSPGVLILGEDGTVVDEARTDFVPEGFAVSSAPGAS